MPPLERFGRSESFDYGQEVGHSHLVANKNALPATTLCSPLPNPSGYLGKPLEGAAVEEASVPKAGGCRRLCQIALLDFRGQANHAITPLVFVALIAELFTCRSIDLNHLFNFRLHTNGSLGRARARGQRESADHKKYPKSHQRNSAPLVAETASPRQSPVRIHAHLYRLQAPETSDLQRPFATPRRIIAGSAFRTQRSVR